MDPLVRALFESRPDLFRIEGETIIGLPIKWPVVVKEEEPAPKPKPKPPRKWPRPR